MRKILIVVVLLAFMTAPAIAEDTFKSDKDKLSYAIGMSIGLNIKKQDVEIDSQLLAAGVKEGFEGEKTQLTEEEMATVLAAFQQEMQMKMMAAAAEAAADNAKKAEEFMAENGKKEGVITTESGLQYQVLTEGTGAIPSADATVEVHYAGTLIDGTEFDSSYKRGQPASFPVGGVIPGWVEALQLMKEGAKWKLAIPPVLAYGERGAPPAIPPNAALVFEVELLKIVK